jgi:hypothetical protein
MNDDENGWPWDLFFEDALFPAGNSLDLIEHVVKIPQDTAAWVFHFSACTGVPCYDRADRVAHHVGTLLEALLHGGSEAIKRNMREHCTPSRRFPAGQPEVVVQNWIASLREIIRIAQTCTWCSWIAGDKEDRQWLLDWRLANPVFDPARSISESLARDGSRDQRAS